MIRCVIKRNGQSKRRIGFITGFAAGGAGLDNVLETRRLTAAASPRGEAPGSGGTRSGNQWPVFELQACSQTQKRLLELPGRLTAGGKLPAELPGLLLSEEAKYRRIAPIPSVATRNGGSHSVSLPATLSFLSRSSQIEAGSVVSAFRLRSSSLRFASWMMDAGTLPLSSQSLSRARSRRRRRSRRREREARVVGEVDPAAVRLLRLSRHGGNRPDDSC